jgi:hypothetical protein
LCIKAALKAKSSIILRLNTGREAARLTDTSTS